MIRIVEDDLELNKETKKEIEIARKQIKKGRYTTHEKLKQELHFIHLIFSWKKDIRNLHFQKILSEFRTLFDDQILEYEYVPVLLYYKMNYLPMFEG